MDAIKRQYLKYACKGAIVTCLVLIITHVLHIEQYYWVLFGAITVLKLNIGASFRRGKERLMGTLAGVIASYFLAKFCLVWPPALYIVLPICITLAIYYFHEYFIAMFFITICFMVAFSMHAPHLMDFSLARIIDTVLGIIIAFLVGLVIWPESIRNALILEFNEYLQAANQLCLTFSNAFINDGIDQTEKQTTLDHIDELYIKLQQGLDLMAHEPGKRKRAKAAQQGLLLHLDQLRGSVYLLGYLATQHGCNCNLGSDLNKQLKQIKGDITVLLKQDTNNKNQEVQNLSPVITDLTKMNQSIDQLTQAISTAVQEQQCTQDTAITIYTYLQAIHDFLTNINLVKQSYYRQNCAQNNQ